MEPERCPCDLCKNSPTCDEAEQHQALRRVFVTLNERQRRIFAGVEALRRGYGGVKLAAQIFELTEKTVRRGRNEITAPTCQVPVDRVRKPGSGRPRVEKKFPIWSSAS